MIFTDHFKLFVFCALSLVVCTQARSVSQFGDIRVIEEDGKFICDKLECPKDAILCFVSKSNEKDPAVLVRTDICYGQDNTPLAEKVTTTSVDPKHKIRAEVMKYRNSVTSTSNDFNEEEFQKEMQKNMEEMNKNMEEMNKNMQTNIQREMSELHENLKNMQHDLEHMFD